MQRIQTKIQIDLWFDEEERMIHIIDRTFEKEVGENNRVILTIEEAEIAYEKLGSMIKKLKE